MKVLVCGGRDYTDWERVENELREWCLEETHCYFDSLDVTEITMIHGGASGADALANKFALKYGMPIEEYKADWDTYGKAAGFIRNFEMLTKGRPDLVIAFPGGRGTANMVKIAKEANVKVLEIKDSKYLNDVS